MKGMAAIVQSPENSPDKDNASIISTVDSSSCITDDAKEETTAELTHKIVFSRVYGRDTMLTALVCALTYGVESANLASNGGIALPAQNVSQEGKVVATLTGAFLLGAL